MNAPQPEEATVGPLGNGGLHVNLKFAGLALVLLPVLVALGAWQLHRADEKTRELAELAAQAALPAQTIDAFAVLPGEQLDGRRVELRGRHDPERLFLLDNRILRGRVGYQLLGLFRDLTGVVVLVDRGWLQAPPTRDRLPPIDTPPGEQILVGSFYVPVDRRRLQLHPAPGWPRVVQALDVPGIARLAGEAGLFPHLVVLDEGQPGVSEGEHARINMPPERHHAYALQWFLMAAALVVVFVLGGTNARELWRQRGSRRRTAHDDDRP